MIGYCTVTHDLRTLTPGGGNVTGTARLVPLLTDRDVIHVQDGVESYSIPGHPVDAVVEGGHLTTPDGGPVQVFAGGEGSNPTSLSWRVEYTNLKIEDTPTRVRPIVFLAVAGGTVDLTDVAPVAGTLGVGTTRGEPGPAPVIIDGAWWVGGVDTGLPAQGPPGEPPRIVDGTWWVGDTDTGVMAQGPQGDDGVSPALTAGSATTLPAGAAPTVGITGTKENPVLNIGVPLPARSPRHLAYTGTGTPLLSDFPDAQIGDYIVRKTDGQEWRVDA